MYVIEFILTLLSTLENTLSSKCSLKCNWVGAIGLLFGLKLERLRICLVIITGGFTWMVEETSSRENLCEY